MTTYGDFSSLLQLGVGIGIGLSVFRAPVDLRLSQLARAIEGELKALRGFDEAFSKHKRRDLLDLQLRLEARRFELEQKQWPFMVVAVVGALVNLLALVVATVDKDRAADGFELYLLLFVSVGWYIALLFTLELLARRKLGPIKTTLIGVQIRRSSDPADSLIT